MCVTPDDSDDELLNVSAEDKGGTIDEMLESFSEYVISLRVVVCTVNLINNPVRVMTKMGLLISKLLSERCVLHTATVKLKIVNFQYHWKEYYDHLSVRSCSLR